MRGKIEFQRRHFEFIADILRVELREALTPHDEALVQKVTERFASNLVLTNDNFDRDRFLRACGKGVQR